jgi:hypothetical protein
MHNTRRTRDTLTTVTQLQLGEIAMRATYHPVDDGENCLVGDCIRCRFDGWLAASSE